MVVDASQEPAEKPAPSPATARHFATHALPPADQFDAWRHHYRPVFDLNLKERSNAAYPADHHAWDLGGPTLTRASMPAGILRRWKHWSRPVIDDWILVVARHDEAARGGPYVGFRSLYREFEAVGGDGEILTLFLPRDDFQREAATFDEAPEQIPWDGMAAIVADYLISLERILPSLSRMDLDRVAEATKSLVTACICPTPAKLDQAREVLTRASFSRAQRIIRQHLYSPQLRPEFLARAAGLSRSTLYRVFASYGGVSSVITRERLNEAHRRLTSTPNPPSIHALAFALHFSDASTFSRAFRRQFGYSPRDAIGLRT